MQWVQSVLQDMQIISWHNLKSNTYITTLKIKSILYLRYTDDILMIWGGSN